MVARHSKARHSKSILLLAAAVSAVGCSPFVRLPRYASPGNTATQQLDALYHDPYPLDDLGPEIVGGRPREFFQPAPAVVRDRLLRGTQTAIPRATTVVPQP
ncbi:MAG: hypothetical protein AAF596_01760 [Planctomycetota bacterium]